MNNILHSTKSSFAQIVNYLNVHKTLLTVFIITYLLLLAVSFLDIMTSQTIASLSPKEYSINQIADRTIIAEISLAQTTETDVSVTEGEYIMRKGFPITEDQYKKLEVLAESPTYIDFRAFGNGVLYFSFFAIIVLCLFSPSILGRGLKVKEAVFFAITLLLVYLVTVIAKKTPTFANQFTLAAVIPASFFVMLITIMFTARLAIFSSILFTLAVLFATEFFIPTSLYILVTSFLSVFIAKKANIRIKLTLVAVALSVINPLCLFVIELIFATTFSGVFMSTLGVAINGFVSGICILGFLTPLEYFCNTASVFRLLDLSDLNNPLMQRMLLNAPGTYNHSMLVATLAETACNEIGANGLLARVGAYYHDIGKLEQPEYFVENQRDGNKHDEINPRLSVSVIRNHVKKGVERCRQMHLPTEVIDIVSQHHGNSTIYYFFNEAKKLNPDVSEEDFSYTGSKPTSKEAAVVMICDTVEAACRTLKDPSVSRLEKFIYKLVLGKFETAQMNNANLTFNDLNKIQNSLVNIMAGYYHSRIEYPNQKDPEDSDEDSTAQKKKKHKEGTNGDKE